MALITPTQDNISPWSSLQNDHCNYVLLIDVTTGCMVGILMSVGVITVGVMTVGVMSVGEITV
jgi:hypothetical protein